MSQPICDLQWAESHLHQHGCVGMSQAVQMNLLHSGSFDATLHLMFQIALHNIGKNPLLRRRSIDRGNIFLQVLLQLL